MKSTLFLLLKRSHALFQDRHVNLGKGKSPGSIACMGKIAASILLKVSSGAIHDHRAPTNYNYTMM